MAEKLNITQGSLIKLNGPNNKPMPDSYEVLEQVDKDKFKILGPNGIPLRVFRSSIISVSVVQKPLNSEELKMVDATPVATAPAPAPAAPTATAEAPAPVVAHRVNKPAKPAKVKAAKVKPAKVSKVLPFDLPAWLKKTGGDDSVHLVKEGTFASPGYKLFCHILVNKGENVYYTLNIYHYPDGLHSLGKKNSGGNKYPLKGKTLKVEHGGSTKVYQGKLSVEELVKAKLADGYKKV